MSDYGIFMQMMRQVAKEFKRKQAAAGASDSKAPEEDEPASSESKK